MQEDIEDRIQNNRTCAGENGPRYRAVGSASPAREMFCSWSRGHGFKPQIDQSQDAYFVYMNLNKQYFM